MIGQIREAIRGSGRSLSELSRETGVGPDRLSRFVRGERTLTLPAAARLCEALGLALSPLTEASAPPSDVKEPPPGPSPAEKKGRRKGKGE